MQLETEFTNNLGKTKFVFVVEIFLRALKKASFELLQSVPRIWTNYICLWWFGFRLIFTTDPAAFTTTPYSNVVKIDSRIIILLCKSRYITHS
jgi:hypothetical protein